MEAASPNVKQSLKACIRSQIASPAVQKAAIQALRKMTINEEVSRTEHLVTWLCLLHQILFLIRNNFKTL